LTPSTDRGKKYAEIDGQMVSILPNARGSSKPKRISGYLHVHAVLHFMTKRYNDRNEEKNTRKTHKHGASKTN